jgi:hypothetical protein
MCSPEQKKERNYQKIILKKARAFDEIAILKACFRIRVT